METKYGNILTGDEETIKKSYDACMEQPVDMEAGFDGDSSYKAKETTLEKAVSVTGPGTFFGKAQRTLYFEPTDEKGWWLDRMDLPGSLPVKVSVNNVWTTARNIVLRSGSPHNYIRMVEHIIALKLGMGLDNIIIRMDSGDPPLFNRSSMDLVEAVEEGKIVEQQDGASYFSVKEPVSIGGPYGSFLTFLPPEGGSRDLILDCAIDFSSAIGKQHIKFKVTPETFRYGAAARTNTTFGMMLYCKTIGKLFADTRNLGYTPQNILIAGKHRYHNEAGLMTEGKSLEAVWHRAVLDLLAAVALIDTGRFAGTIISYKAGHALDVDMIKELRQRNLLSKI